MDNYEERRKIKKQHAVVISEDEEGLIGITGGDFPVHMGPMDTEVTVNDIPIKLVDVPHIVLHHVKCDSCNKEFWVREKGDVRACPVCCSGAIEFDDALPEQQS